MGADHEFHDLAFAQNWADRFTPTPERLQLFELILQEITSVIPDGGQVAELGIGPGYLGKYLLDAVPNISYQGIDFSLPMLDIASKRLTAHAHRMTCTQADFISEAWEDKVHNPDAIVSTWALHDLGVPAHIEAVYATAFQLLPSGGLLVNGDFIKPAEAAQRYEPGRFEISKHLQMLEDAGFSHVECLAVFETELADPTAAQNYACIKAIK